MARRSTLLVVLILAVGGVASGVSTFDLPRNLADDVFSNQQAAALTAFNASDTCPEDVHLTGNIHLVTDIRRIHGVVEITVVLTLDAHGVGALTGARYLATGTVRKDVATPTLPARIPIQAIFNFIPLGACRLPHPQEEHLPVRFELAFDATGNLIRLTTPPEFGEPLLGLNQVRLAAFTIFGDFSPGGGLFDP
jgi:hypothetical protein